MGAGAVVGLGRGGRLFRARGEERQRVFAQADRLRREVNGDVVTYVVTRNVQYTNVCYFRCGFCAFSRGHRAGEGYFLPVEEVLRRAREAVARFMGVDKILTTVDSSARSAYEDRAAHSRSVDGGTQKAEAEEAEAEKEPVAQKGAA